MRALLASFCLLAFPAQAEDFSEAQEQFITANLLGIFYHELGHALIDYMNLPIFGQEEDAADVLSVFLTDAFYDEETAVSLAYDTAFGFQGEAAQAEDVAYWDVHGPDLQRYYNLVCLFYGANPDEREDVAEELGLPEERAAYCPEEYDQAANSWGGVMDQLAEAGAGETLVLAQFEADAPGAVLIESVIAPEITALNAEFSLPDTLDVNIAQCGEANAYYDPGARAITMCTEFVEHLAQQTPWD